MKKNILTLKVTTVLIVGLSTFVSYGQAQEFSKYPAEQAYTGKPAKLQLTEDNGGLTFKTKITQAVKKGANFASKYTVVEIGCGGSCLVAYVVDLRSGKLIDFPLGGEENYQMQLKYNTKSRLIKAVWNDTETTPNKACVIDYLEIKNDKFKEISSTRKLAQDGFCDAYAK